eukprot:SAG22_NODE_347_length_11873_cov_15.313997_2_plen_115_part_00
MLLLEESAGGLCPGRFSRWVRRAEARLAWAKFDGTLVRVHPQYHGRIRSTAAAVPDATMQPTQLDAVESVLSEMDAQLSAIDRHLADLEQTASTATRAGAGRAAGRAPPGRRAG